MQDTERHEESSVKYRRNNEIKLDQNNNILTSSSQLQNNYQKASFMDHLKTVLLYLLPHLAILILFLVYSLIGAAIFKEIELDRLADDSVFQANRLQKDIDVFEIRKQEYYSNSNQLKRLIKEQNLQISSNLNNLLRDNLTSGEAVLDTLEFINKLNLTKNTSALKKTVANHLTEFKARSKFDLKTSIIDVLNKHKSQQVSFETEIEELSRRQDALISNLIDMQLKEFSNSNVKHDSASNLQTCIDDGCDAEKKEHWKFLASFYFIVTSLTSIGYRGLIPQTIAGKLFVMVYLIIGLPLTLILLSDIGKLLTRYLNFLGTLYAHLCSENYFDPIVKHLERSRVPITSLMYGLIFSRVKIPRPSSSQTNPQKRISAQYSTAATDKELTDSQAQQANKPTIKVLFQEVLIRSVQQSDDTFHFSFGLLSSIIFAYLSLGALVFARMLNVSIFDGYYFTLFMLTKIDSGDPVIEYTSSMIAICVYVLIGMSFFSLTIKYLQEKIRQVLLRNGRNIIAEVTKFTNQFGYNLKSDDFNLSLSHDVSRIVVEKSNDVALAKAAAEAAVLVNARKSSDRTVQKSDKQTQITTLLYSKLKYENFKVVLEEESVEETPLMKLPMGRSKFSFDSEKIKNSTSTPSIKRRSFVDSHLTTR